MKLRVLVGMLAVALMVAGTAAATTYRVRTDGDDGAAGTSWATALKTVTNALAKAAAYDSIWVAEGTYTPGNARTDVFTIGDRVYLYGGFTNGMGSLGARDWVAHPTILSGEIGAATATDNCYMVVTANVQNAILDGFTVTRGYGAPKGAGLYCGPGVYGVMTIQNCVFEDNWSSGDGGGFYLENISTVNNCTFQNNTAVGKGGGVRFDGYNRAPAFSDCVFSNNLAAQGGGFSCKYMKGSLLDCLFVDNTAGFGGGLEIERFGPSVTKCAFVSNEATGNYGGGLYGSTVEVGGLQSCVFVRNTTGLYGGGAYFTYGTYAMPMVGCTFATNTAANGGGLAANRSNVMMTNCIVWGNVATSSRPEIYAYTTASGVPKVSWSNIRGSGGSGAGWDPGGLMAVVDQGNNIDIDPEFVDVANNDVHLKSYGGHWTPSGWVTDSITSPCVDAGPPPPWPVGDEPTPNGDRINMGAYGGTDQASKTFFPPDGTLVLIR